MTPTWNKWTWCWAVYNKFFEICKPCSLLNTAMPTSANFVLLSHGHSKWERLYSQSGSQRPVAKVNSLIKLSPSLFYMWGKLLFLPVKEGAEYQIFQIAASCTRPGDEQFPQIPTRCMEDLPLTVSLLLVRTDLGEFWLYWAGPTASNQQHACTLGITI